eukprot:m.222563 g.222563  ORF g.222563 m.222563 type:complete len:687 (+) comp33377_c0_seq1:151-2211(+)
MVAGLYNALVCGIFVGVSFSQMRLTSAEIDFDADAGGEQYPYNPCGVHGRLLNTRCVCTESCHGSHCVKGHEAKNPAVVVWGYNVDLCPDCTCRPARKPDVFSEVKCNGGAKASAVVLVLCCHDEKEQENELEILDMDSIKPEPRWFEELVICYVLISRSYGYNYERVESSFLGYLAASYDDLPTTLIFSHLENEWHDQFDKGSLLNGSNLATVSELEPFLPLPSPTSHDTSSEEARLKFWKPFQQEYGLVEPRKDHTSYHCCSQFMVHSSVVLSHPKSMYEALKAATFNNNQHSHLLELAWESLYAPPQIKVWKGYWDTISDRMAKWRTRAHMAGCAPWACTCQMFSEKFGASPGAIGGVTEAQMYWWKNGAYSQYPSYILDVHDHSKSRLWALLSPAGRLNHGVGSCSTTPQNAQFKVLPALRQAINTTSLPFQHIPRIVWQTHFTNKLPPAGQYIFDLRERNPEYTFHLISDSEADAFMEKFEMPRVRQAYFSINPSLGASRADVWRYAALYQHGGIYLDIDSSCQPFRDIIKPEDVSVLSWAGQWHRKFCSWDREIDQWVMMFAPRHPFLKRALQLASARVLDPNVMGHRIRNMHGHVLVTTGPNMFKDAVNYVLKESPNTPHRLMDEDYHEMCQWKVLGYTSTALDSTKDISSEQLDYKQAGGTVFSRPGIWKRSLKKGRG